MHFGGCIDRLNIQLGTISPFNHDYVDINIEFPGNQWQYPKCIFNEIFRKCGYDTNENLQFHVILKFIFKMYENLKFTQ